MSSLPISVSVNPSVNQQISQSLSQSVSQSINQSLNQSSHQSPPTQPNPITSNQIKSNQIKTTNQPTKQPRRVVTRLEWKEILPAYVDWRNARGTVQKTTRRPERIPRGTPGLADYMEPSARSASSAKANRKHRALVGHLHVRPKSRQKTCKKDPQ